MSDHTLPDLDDVRSRLASAIHAHWKLFLAEGIVMMVLGLLAIAVPEVASLVITIFIGWLFFIGGIFRTDVAVAASRHAGIYLGAADRALGDRSRSGAVAAADCGDP